VVDLRARLDGSPRTSDADCRWKTAVFEVLKESCHTLSQPIAVELTFRLQPTRLASTALTNLLKAAIDGVGRAVFLPKPRARTPWDTEDHWIVELVCSKVPDEQDGLDILIRDVHPPTELEGACWIAGRPYPGECDPGTSLWRGKVRNAALHLPPREELTLRVFRSRWSDPDLDNLVRPIVEGLSNAWGVRTSYFTHITASKHVANDDLVGLALT
jgi:hypothetical protein